MIKNTTLIIICFILSSCYSTKHLKKDDVILKKNNIIVNNQLNNRIKGISKKEIREIIKQKPNKKIFNIIPFHVFIYSLSNPTKNNWINTYLRKIGEQPVNINNALIKESALQISSHLENNGYFTSTVSSKIEYKKRKAIVNYNISTGDSYLINKIDYSLIKNISQHIYQSLILDAKHIKKGDIFTYKEVNNERIRITELFKENGYYKFTKENIFIEADSVENKLINLEFKLEDSLLVQPNTYTKFIIENIYIQLNEDTNSKKDTTFYKGIYFITSNNNKHVFKKNNLIELIKIIPHSLYSKKKVNNTYENISNIDYFKRVTIEFVETAKNKLKCNINLTYPTKMYYSVEAEAKRSSDEGNFGLSSYLQFGNNNLLNSGEKLNSTVRLSLENRQTSIENSDQLFNTREINYEIGLKFPKLIIPHFIKSTIAKSYDMHTNFKITISKKNSPDFTSQNISQNISYNWRTQKNTQHKLNLIELSFSKIENINSYIQDQINSNPFLNEQFEDKFIPSTNYTLVYNNQELYRNSNYSHIILKLETSGNFFKSISSIMNLNQNENGNYMIFNNPFSQYVKLNVDLRRFLMFKKDNVFAFRMFYGIGYAYGNSDVLPIQKQFFSGGVNSIRAWEAFSLGPGSILNNNDIYYSTGDIKFEFNMEYRFAFINALKSALFIDGGNIWSIQNDIREGSMFKINNFMNQLAIGFGYGLRYDFNFFVIRLDIATKLKDPTLETNNSWVKRPLNQKFRYNLAIGYPF